MVRRRPLLRAAVVGGGAYAAGRAHARNQAEVADREADQEARLGSLESQQVPAQRPGQAPPESSMTDQLSELSRMHDSGVLTDEEFAAAKARLIG
jgi:myosin heavy subunit